MESILRQVAYGGDDYLRLLALREAVLRAPLGLTFTPEQLAGDAADTHFALLANGAIIGGIIVGLRDAATVKIRQMVVEPDHQKHGHGGRLLQHAHAHARANGRQHAMLHARQTAVPFYEHHGYRIIGEPFTEVTLPHRKMTITFATI